MSWGERMRVVDIKRRQRALALEQARIAEDVRDLHETVEAIRKLHPDHRHGCAAERIVGLGRAPAYYPIVSCPTRDIIRRPS